MMGLIDYMFTSDFHWVINQPLNRNRTLGFASYQRDSELDYSHFHTQMKSDPLIIHRQAIKP